MEDKRVRKSKEALKTALLTLRSSKELKDISVTELCRKAGLNRSTFYANYTDINALAADCVTDLLHWLLTDMNSQPSASDGMTRKTVRDSVKRFLTYMKENPAIFRILYDSEERFLFVSQIIAYAGSSGQPAEACRRYRDLYCVVGAFAVTRQWFLDGCSFPVEDMTTLLCSLLSASGEVPIST